MIWSSSDVDPYADDEIRADASGRDYFETEEIPNHQLEAVYGIYPDAEELMPFVGRIFWLAAVKEAIGTIPTNFNLSYDEIEGLVWYHQEVSKKMQYDSWKMHQQQHSFSSKMR